MPGTRRKSLMRLARLVGRSAPTSKGRVFTTSKGTQKAAPRRSERETDRRAEVMADLFLPGPKDVIKLKKRKKK